jgi:hypothetical protein
LFLIYYIIYYIIIIFFLKSKKGIYKGIKEREKRRKIKRRKKRRKRRRKQENKIKWFHIIVIKMWIIFFILFFNFPSPFSVIFSAYHNSSPKMDYRNCGLKMWIIFLFYFSTFRLRFPSYLPLIIILALKWIIAIVALKCWVMVLVLSGRGWIVRVFIRTRGLGPKKKNWAIANILEYIYLPE